MKIVESPEFRAELIKKIDEREFSDRSGIHMSDLNYCLNKQALRKLFPVKDTEHETLLFSLGWATQRWLTGADEDEPSKEVDGILVTCDALTDTPEYSNDGQITEGASFPWELKATYQSSNRAIEDNTAWLRQIMAQCYIQGTTEAYLTRFELMGDWGSVYPRGSTKEEKQAYRNDPAHSKPTLHAYKLSFTREELEKNWQWFTTRRDAFTQLLANLGAEKGVSSKVSALLLPKVQALPSGGAYECEYCSYRGGLCSG